ncbi:MAG: peptidoglycan endopeptidase [Desulfuromonadaceae bacterium]|nr:peptidoglycan endopeptidase [Desulfuromonadaceae bacterium]
MTAEASEYAVAQTATPVLNSPDFKEIFGGVGELNLKTDRCGQVRALEFIALPGSVFKIIKKLRSGPAEIYQVETDEYTAPAGVRLYVDTRFLTLEHVVPKPRNRTLPPQDYILAMLKDAVGSRYVWGGNVLSGIPSFASWYRKGLRDDAEERNILDGLDCSGLLYHATGGWTPRNTSQLITVGAGVPIAGKLPAEIVPILQPLDLIVWNGHVIIVLDQHTVIESRLDCGKPGNGGVVLTGLSQRLAGIMRTRHPADTWIGANKHQDAFVVRRWYSQ